MGSIERTKFDEIHVTNLEKWIDEMDAELPPLTHFILPVRRLLELYYRLISFYNGDNRHLQ
jgi:cob(I)alamin adenosyltransferase